MMVEVDLSKLSLAELRDLSTRVSNETFLAEARSKQEAVDRKIRLAQSVTNLSNLLGPTGATAGTDSIRAVLAYGDETIAANPGQAVTLILHGLEVLTQTTLDLAKGVSEL
jgi:hypothetical protein